MLCAKSFCVYSCRKTCSVLIERSPSKHVWSSMHDNAVNNIPCCQRAEHKLNEALTHVLNSCSARDSVSSVLFC